MKNFAELLSTKLFHNNYINKLIFIIVLFVFSISFFIYSLANHDVALPENPLEQVAEDSSFVPLQGDFKHLLENEEDEIGDREEEQEEQTDEEQSEEEQLDKDIETENNDDVQEEKELKTDDGKGGSNYNNPDSSHIEIIEDPEREIDDENRNDYFTTTIVDGEIVTEENYEFRIIQLNHDYIVNTIEVLLNGKPIDDFAGTVMLKEGDNEITITVTYQDKKGGQFSVTRHYKVILNTKEIIIYTNLENEQVFENETITFTASAMYDGKSLPVEVEINEKKVRNTVDDNYEAQLKEDDNKIVITAKHSGKEAKKERTVYLKPNTSSLTIETDLKDVTVTNEQFSFFAIAKDDEVNIPLTALLNDEVITDDGNGNFTVTLQEGRNTVVLTATNDEKTIEKTFTINLNLPNGGSKDEEIDSNIYIDFPDLKEGQTIRNSVHTFHVKVVDKYGKQITDRAISITAKNNGENIPIDWNNNSLVSYTLSVVDGANFIEVTAKDNDGNIGTASLTVYGDIASDDEPIGTITFSLEATTIGIGYIIPPQEVELYPNERGSNTIDRIFKKHGISYHYVGNHESGFYLSYIKKPGIVQNPKIPDDLAELLVRDFSYFDPNGYDPNSLGEFDFTNGSGWMYSVNGHYPNVGFSNYYFKDGDVVRIRFTLALGNDIGGGIPGRNYGKEW